MKKALMSIALLAFVTNIYAQDQTSKASMKEYYLQKSKDKKTTGFVMFGIGTAAIIGGTISANNNPNDVYSVSDAEGFLIVGGIILDLVSIPFFISAGHFSSKAAQISLSSQKNYLLQKNIVAARYTPAISIKISF
jgi:hypothetical protein